MIVFGIIFQQILNFTYDLTKPPDGQWGSIQPDNSWSGLVGMLMAEEIDMGRYSDNFIILKTKGNWFLNPISPMLSKKILHFFS